jgi:hypothetical protein
MLNPPCQDCKTRLSGTGVCGLLGIDAGIASAAEGIEGVDREVPDECLCFVGGGCLKEDSC